MDFEGMPWKTGTDGMAKPRGGKKMFPVGFFGVFFEGGMPTWGFNIGIYILTCFKCIFGGGVSRDVLCVGKATGSSVTSLCPPKPWNSLKIALWV